MVRKSPSCEKTGLKKGAWTPEEDKKLVAYIERYGHWNWRELPKYAGLSRCGKSCRLRWMNYLRPNLKRGHFSKEEEDIIVNMHRALGNKWAAISAKLPGRTDNEIKNHWHTNLKKRLKKVLTKSSEPHQTSSSSQSGGGGGGSSGDGGDECNTAINNNEQESWEPSGTSLLPAPSSLQITSEDSSVPLSPVPSLSDFSYSSSTDSTTSTNWMGDENSANTVLSELFSGDFWTDSYVGATGNPYIQENFPDTWAYPEILFPFSFEESLSTYGPIYEEDGYIMELFN